MSGEFLFGMLAALGLLAAAGFGFLTGWTAARRQRPKAADSALSQEERQRIRDEEEAWRRVMEYSAADVYGLNETTAESREGL